MLCSMSRRWWRGWSRSVGFALVFILWLALSRGCMADRQGAYRETSGYDNHKLLSNISIKLDTLPRITILFCPSLYALTLAQQEKLYQTQGFTTTEYCHLYG